MGFCGNAIGISLAIASSLRSLLLAIASKVKGVVVQTFWIGFCNLDMSNTGFGLALCTRLQEPKETMQELTDADFM